MADTKKLMQDLITVLDEHGVEYTSFTTTQSKKRLHGQIQFEEQLAGDKQEKLGLSTKEA